MHYNAFLVAFFPGCLYSQLNIDEALSIEGTCLGTCGINSVVHFICIQSSSHSFGSATCVAQSTWDQTCVPAGEYFCTI